MMQWLPLVLAAVRLATAASTASEIDYVTTQTASSFAESLTEIPTNSLATYPTYSTTYSLTSYTSLTGSLNDTYTSTVNGTSSHSTKVTESVLTGTYSSITTTISASRTTTATSATATNTQPCNGYTEFCGRKYSNITYVVAHNSPFVVPNNLASNQALHVTTQLNDGIRALEFETHKPNSTSPMMLCHTSCDELNVGPLVDYLTTVREWLDKNRYEVITIIMGNDDFVDPGNYTSAVTDSGILDYLYIPETYPMGLSGWPTLAEMIIRNKRVVMFLDYDADQTKIPWLLEQWNYLWQTPFSPTDPNFPCTVQRPPNQDAATSADRLYTANHNLNVDIDVSSLGLNILVPDWSALNNTNANITSVPGSATSMVENCTATWNRPPNFLLVDYYNYGNFPGSILAAAAKANNVSYNTASCCGMESKNAASAVMRDGKLWIVGVMLVMATVWG